MSYLPNTASRAVSVAAAVGVLLAVLCGSVPAAAAKPRHAAQVRGVWESLGPCAFTSFDPATNQGTCTGATAWRGTWTGITHYTFRGTFDPLTNNADGTIEETFVGTSAGGGSGTMRFEEAVTLDGATGRIHIDARLVGGTGDFTGSRGFVTFEGRQTADRGGGSFAGRWTRPNPRAQSAHR